MMKKPLKAGSKLNSKVIRFLFLLLFVFILNSAKSQSLYFPPNTSNTWDTISPLTQNYCSDRIDSLYEFLEINNSKAFILLKDGKIVLEKYFDTFARDSVWYWASAGKTLTAVLVGIAQQENLLNISDSTSKYLGRWSSAPLAKEGLITIEDQLKMTSGLDDGVFNPDCTNDSCLQYLSDAGTRWAYHNAPYTLLDTVIQVASGQNINSFHLTRLRNPIGMGGLYLKLGYNNVYFSNARTMARFGLFLLAKGNWNGQVILSDTTYFNQMTNSSQSLNPSYGYLTWLNGKSSYMLPQSQFVFPGSLNLDAPSDMFAALGKDAQLINIVPSQKLVWIRIGNPPNISSGLIAPVFNNSVWQKINQLTCPVSIENVQENQVKVYPNPVKDFLKIEFESQIEFLEIINPEGQMILIRKNVKKNSFNLSLESINKGVYFLKIIDIHGVQTTYRLIKN